MTITWKHKPLAGSKPQPWEARRYGACAFPFDSADGTLSCCLPVVGDGSYCLLHNKIVYVQSPQPQRRLR